MIITKTHCIILVAGVLLLLNGITALAQKTKVNVSEIKSDKGNIVLSLFKDQETFRNEKPFKKIVFTKKGLVNGAIELNLAIEPGIYGITILDDEDKNGEMEKNLVGIPKEGFGFSNFYLDKLKRPVFDDFKTEIKTGENTVVIRAKYM